MAIFWMRFHTFVVSTTSLLMHECKTIRDKSKWVSQKLLIS